MKIENVAGIGFAAWRAAEQQRYLTVCPGLFRQIVKYDQRILTLVEKILAH